MSSIEEKDKELLAAEFFNEILLPLALAERAAGKSFFPLRADPEAESYYAEPTRPVMTPSDFELRAAETVADFIDELAALWVSEGHEEHAAMAHRLSELAAEMCEQEESEDDVPPFVYAMF